MILIICMINISLGIFDSRKILFTTRKACVEYQKIFLVTYQWLERSVSRSCLDFFALFAFHPVGHGDVALLCRFF